MNLQPPVAGVNGKGLGEARNARKKGMERVLPLSHSRMLSLPLSPSLHLLCRLPSSRPCGSIRMTVTYTVSITNSTRMSFHSCCCGYGDSLNVVANHFVKFGTAFKLVKSLADFKHVLAVSPFVRLITASGLQE